MNKISRKTLARVGPTRRYISEYKSNYNQQFGRRGRRGPFFRIKRLQHTPLPGSEGKQCSNFSQEFQGSDRQGLNQLPKAYAGNLQYHIENWRKLTSDPWILETVTGYHLEFDSIPKQTGIPKPPPFGGFEKQLIDDEIVTLKSKGASKEVTYCSNEFLSNIILVTKKTGDMRPVINLKPKTSYL